MKKTLLLLLGLTMVACSDDDNNNVDNGLHNPYTGEVTGEWVTTGITVDDMIFVPDCDNPELTAVKYYYNFNNNGTVDVYNSCEVDGELDIEMPITTGTYTTTGNVFTLTIDGVQGKAHMVDFLDEFNSLDLRFDIGSSGLFYGQHITIQYL